MNKRFNKIGRFALIAVFMLICVFALASCAQLTELFNPKPQHTVCVDINRDSVCDTCGKPVTPPKQPECSVHVDQNNDGACDKCSAAVLKNMTGITFTGAPFTYDGTDKKIEVVGAPAGASVTYDIPNVQKNVGEYKITATVTCEGYNPYTVSATMYINAKTIIISWGENLGPFPSNGNAPEIEYTLDGVVDGDEVEVTFNFADCDFTVPGTYEVTAVSANPNYKIRPKEAKTEIIMGVNAHTVTFVTGIEDKTIDPEEVVDGEKLEAPRTPNNFGYDLEGWYNGDVKWNFNDPVTESMTLTAKWKASEYTITYYLNGGVNSPENPDTFTVETEKQLAIPTKEGCIFLGWYKDKEFLSPAVAIGSTRANMTVYAKWGEKYTELSDTFTVDGESSVVLSESAVNGNFTYTFTANVTEFGEDGVIYIGRGKNTLNGTYVAITSNKITVYTNTADGQTVQNKGHVRDIFGYVVVNVMVAGGKATVTIHTAEGESSSSDINWAGRVGEIFFSAENASFEDASFGWSTNAYAQPVWIVGDANVGLDSDTYWTKQLVDYGFGDFLSIGAEGLNSSEALRLFKEATKTSVPMFAVWSFGKENNDSFAEVMDDFVSFCEEKRITPILTTQPTVGAYDNAAENAYVKASGERYIDFEAACANEGVFSNDEYTILGAKTLYARVMVDFPEIICADAPIRATETVDLDPIDSSASTGAPAGALTMHGNVIKDGKYMVFTAKMDGELPEGQVIKLGHGYRQSSSTWLEITTETVMAYSFYGYNDPPLANALSGGPRAHGLNIKNYITVVICRDNDDMGSTLTILTDGGYYQLKRGEGLSWGGEIGDMFALIDYGSATHPIGLTDAMFNWVCKDYTKDIWIIGDSYLGFGNAARWPYHMYNAGFQNALMAGYAGMASKAGLADFEDALQYAKPKFLVWCMGMNDGDKNGVVNSNYYDCAIRVLELCEEYGITPVLSTIPTCLAVDNGPKNYEILNRIGRFGDFDYRIIDFARAVDGYVDQENATWYENMLYSDKVHPDLLGAKALYMQFAHDFPEIACGWDSTVYESTLQTLSSSSTLKINHNEKIGSQMYYTFTADYTAFNGALIIGNDKNVEGATWVEITDTKVRVYQKCGEENLLLAENDNPARMEHLVTVNIYVNNGKATVSIQGTGDKVYDSSNKRVFNFTVDWNYAGDVCASASGAQLFRNASLKWYTAE